jgi:CRISPR-associated endonuclease/helicase Cas3
MRERIGSIYTKLYAPDTTPSFILAHSASDLARALQPKPSPIPMATLEAPGEDLSYGAQHTAGQQCAAWLQDNRKKALLAQVGVGTLDQVLLGVLPSRHAPLRLVGLARKVLIVDEVHAYDPYMHALLQQVLKFHATFGGSAILLSATLPAQMRAQLIAAFRGGAGDSSAEPPVLQEDYPLLTRVDTTQVEQRPLACRAGAARAVAVRFVDSSAAALDTLTAVVRAGGCAVWIRNTVGDALEALEQAEASGLSPEQLTLFHARFTLGDRLAIEEDVLARFGKRSTPESRAGRLVIATQVVEQSLDLDFDFMVSDLAPIDLLIQRAGRLHRHARAERPAIARAPVLGVLAPPWAGEPGDRWVQDVLPGTGAVYQHHGQLWLTMYALLQRGRLATPDDSRALVETVYGELVDVPEGLLGRTWEAEGEALAQQGTADLNKLELLSGYEHKGAWLSETRTPTRLGEQQATWQLGYQDGAHVVPLWGQAGAPPWLRWRLSQVQLRHKLFAERTGPLAAIAEQSEPEHQPKWIRRLLLTATDEGVWVGQGQDHKEKPIEVLYDRRRGLRVQKGSHE